MNDWRTEGTRHWAAGHLPRLWRWRSCRSSLRLSFLLSAAGQGALPLAEGWARAEGKGRGKGKGESINAPIWKMWSMLCPSFVTMVNKEPEMLGMVALNLFKAIELRMTTKVGRHRSGGGGGGVGGWRCDTAVTASRASEEGPVIDLLCIDKRRRL